MNLLYLDRLILKMKSKRALKKVHLKGYKGRLLNISYSILKTKIFKQKHKNKTT